MIIVGEGLARKAFLLSLKSASLRLRLHLGFDINMFLFNLKYLQLEREGLQVFHFKMSFIVRDPILYMYFKRKKCYELNYDMLSSVRLIPISEMLKCASEWMKYGTSDVLSNAHLFLLVFFHHA